jgi:hypothetical protein
MHVLNTKEVNTGVRNKGGSSKTNLETCVFGLMALGTSSCPIRSPCLVLVFIRKFQTQHACLDQDP